MTGRRLDPGLLLTLALCLFAVWPVLIHDGLLTGTDTMLHAYRAAELNRAWSHGLVLPTWAESFYYGYGSPVFHYYAGLFYEVVTLLVRVLGVDVIGGVRWFMVLATLGAGAGMYRFIQQRSGTLGGVIAALCYVYSPYLLFTEPYTRGDFPEWFALMLFPVVMWRFERLLHTGRARDVALAVLFAAALALTHNLMGVILFGLLVGWLLWGLAFDTAAARLLGAAAGIRARAYGMALLAAGLGVGLTAFFWLPVLLESQAVSLDNLTTIPELDYRNAFLSPARLLGATARNDTGAANGFFLRLNLGTAQWLLALVGFAAVGLQGALRRRYDRVFGQALFFGAAGLALVFLITPAADGLWARIGPLRFLQFPWRLLGPAGFCLAALIGLSAGWIGSLATWQRRFVNGRTLTAGLAALGVVMPVALAFPMLYVPNWLGEDGIDTSVAAYHREEVAGTTSPGTTASNEFLPRDVHALPGATQSLMDDYADGDGTVNKVNPNSLPPGAVLVVLEHGPQHDLWRIESPVPFTLEVMTFYFAGWQAEIDGLPAEVTPSSPHGFITVPVPAGEHTVRVFMGSTPPRDLGNLVTTVSVLGLLLTVGLARIRGQAAQPAPAAQPDAPFAVLYTGISIGLGLNILLALVLMRPGLAWVESPPGEAWIATHRLEYSLGTAIRLLGYDLSTTYARPGDQVDLVLYWYASEPIPHRYQSFVHVSTGGAPLAQADKQVPAGRLTTEWPVKDGYMRDEYTIRLPDTMPPGEYGLYVGLYTCETRPVGECGSGDRLPVQDGDGQDLGDVVPLVTIFVQ